MRVNEAYKISVDSLKKSGCQSPDFDAMCLLENAFGFTRTKILQIWLDEIPEDIFKRYIDDINKRANKIPLQYIIGSWEFMGLNFSIGPGVLIPRADTEILVETAIDYLKSNNIKNPDIIDLCSGSGAIAISIAEFVEKSNVTALELSDDALEYLQFNNKIHNNKINIIKHDILIPYESDIKYNCIVSNPPYISKNDMQELMEEVKYEPQMALYGGIDGLDFYRAIIQNWIQNLESGGLIAFEIGKGQHIDIAEMLSKAEIKNIFMKQDLSGLIRVVGGYKT